MSQNKKDRYQSYLKRKHAGFSTSEKLLNRIVRKATGSNIINDERIIEGEVNEVHRISTDSEKEIIVRISRSKYPRFETEQWAIDKAREAGVPAPEILLIENINSADETLTFCVQKRIEGERLKELMHRSGKDSELIREITIDAGVNLASIHSVATNGYGNLTNDGKGRYDSWQDYMLSWTEKEEELIKCANDIGIQKKSIKSSIDILIANKKTYLQIEPHLLHGDYGGDHIFIKDGKVCGIIDFENCKGGDIAWDFAWWSYFGDNRPSIEWLLEGYEKISNLGEDFQLRLDLCKLRLGLDMIWYYHYENNEVGQEYAKRRMDEILDDFSG